MARRPPRVMTDRDLEEWWPDLGTVVIELRRNGQASVADLLVDAVGAGVTSTEVLGAVGLILRRNIGSRAALSDVAKRAWDAVISDVHRAWPGYLLRYWLARLTHLFGSTNFKAVS